MRPCLWLLFAVLASSGCSRTASWAANVGVDDDRIESRTYDTASHLALDVHSPVPRPGAAGAGAPVVVYFHGGRWRDGDRQAARFVGQRLADAGALVVVPDFRQAPAHAFPDFMHDAAKAVAWTRANAPRYGGDPSRVFVMGHSSGAHIAALLGTDGRYLAGEGMAPKALAGVIGWSGPYDFLPIREVDLVDVFGTGERWPATQPVNFVDGDEPAFLLLHGADDDTVLPANSTSLHRKLGAAGIRSRLVTLPDTGHAGVLLELKLPGTGPALAETLRFVGLGTGADAAPPR